MLVGTEFERLPTKDLWEQTIARAQDADNPDSVVDEQLAATERRYRSAFTEIPEDQLDEMLSVLEAALRRRAGLILSSKNVRNRYSVSGHQTAVFRQYCWTTVYRRLEDSIN